MKLWEAQPNMYQGSWTRDLHERYYCTLEYGGIGRYSSKFQNLRYQWVPRIEEILEDVGTDASRAPAR